MWDANGIIIAGITFFGKRNEYMKYGCLAIAISVVLAGCATTQNVKPEDEAKIRQKQSNYEKNAFKVKYQNQLATNTGGIELILRDRVPATEPNLTIVQRRRTAALSALVTVGVLATGGTYAPQGFSKDELKGKVLEPTFPNPILDVAKPAFENWLIAHHDGLAPAHQPLTKVTVTAQRFALIYPKLVGKESYELNNELYVTFQNSWNNDKAYGYLCDIKSAPKTLEQWQANDYAAVSQAVADNTQTCLKELEGQAGKIYQHLSK